MLLVASVRGDVANYLSDLFGVYIALILIHVLASFAFSFGLRPGYSRWLDMVLNFLREVCDPYLRIFRRIIPSVGMMDFSPIIAIVVLGVLSTVIVSLVRG
ncbi:YggT family protein [Conexibacter sp. S30A1]|jgi:YggT family protein|uniref:YggT family protein n=1 Tax=Conexibacter sp. S30A1 TaxID=2937800 RepID=UPI00201053A3|nr:YggT family protein [Conexibacter sp. S30A1]